MKKSGARALLCAVLTAASVHFALAEDGAPAAVPPPDATAPAKAVVPDVAKSKPVKAKAAPAASAKTDAPETLPWAAGAAAPATTEKPAKDKAKLATPGDAPLAMPCPGLYEAACREVSTCNWIADVTLGSGADVKAHCVDRAGKKDGAAKKAPDKKAATAAVKIKPPASPAPAAPVTTVAPVAPPPAATP